MPSCQCDSFTESDNDTYFEDSNTNDTHGMCQEESRIKEVTDKHHDIHCDKFDKPNETEFYEFKVMSQNGLGLKDNQKIEHAIDNMIENHADAYLLQETWLIGANIQTTRGCAFFYHGLSNASCSRGERGVAIVMSPKF